MKNTDNKKKTKILMFLFVIVIIAVGTYLSYKNGSEPGLFIGGSFLFFLGLFMGMYLKTYGIIGLFPMGFVGYYLMRKALEGDLYSNPLLTDINATKFYLYLDFINFLAIIGVISVFIYRFSDSLKKKKYIDFLPVSILSLSLILLGILPSILKYFA